MPFSTSADTIEDLIQLKKKLANANPADERCLPYKEVLVLKRLLKEFGKRYDLEQLEKENDLEVILSMIIFHLANETCLTFENPTPLNLSVNSQNGNHEC